MPLLFDFEEAVFLERPNRFVSVIRLQNGETVKAHVPDPGRLKELLLPGVKVLIKDHGNNKPLRKLRYTLERVYSQEGHLVSLNTQLPNTLIAHLLEKKELELFKEYTLLKREVKFGQSRFDFLLAKPDGSPCFLEVKSVTLVENGCALFPDAPSVRGTKHLEELMLAKQQGYEGRVLFVIQRGDPDRFSPNAKTDPVLANTLAKAMASGIHANALCFTMTPETCHYVKEVPIILS